MATGKRGGKIKIHHRRILLEVLILIVSVPIWRGIWEILDIIIGKSLLSAFVSIVIGIIAVWFFTYYSHYLKLD